MFDAELYAIFKAVTFICRERIPSVIFSDSQSALTAIYSGQSSHPVIAHISQTILESDTLVCLAWIPSHIGLTGNEKADKLAKQSLNYNIITPVPVSLKTFKKISSKCIYNFWERTWEALTFFKYRITLQRFDSELRHSRREEIALCRLRTGVTLMTHILPYINGQFPPICEECYELQTIKHILIDCIKYIRERRAMCNYLTAQNMNISVFNLLQDDPEMIEYLIQYLHDTELIKEL